MPPTRLQTVAGHRATKLLVAFGIGLALAAYALHIATDPRTAARRAEEEAMVEAAREILRDYCGGGAALEIVDPLAPDRAIGKAYVYPREAGFEVSGYYRRGEGDRWHPFLMRLNDASNLVELSVRDDDAGLRRQAAGDPKLSVQSDGEK